MNEDQILNSKLIQKLIEKHKCSNLPRFEKLERYYNNENKILGRTLKDASKPNNKIAHPYAEYITDVLTAYFMGEGVSYSSIGMELDKLTPILNYNDAADQDMELAKDCSIYGIGIELLYIDADGMERFRRIDPKECILVYDTSLEEEMLYCIRFYPEVDLLTDEITNIIEVYGRDDIAKYKCNNQFNGMTEISREKHYFNLVPVSVYYNNEEVSGDFEKVIHLIDAYDLMESESLNNQEYFSDCYLTISGMTMDEETVGNMKNNRVLLLDEGCSAEWLIKQENDALVENMKNRLDNDIHKFSKVPNMSDQEFSNNSSGVAIKYKTMAIENLAAIKERKFKKGLQRRIELIFNTLNLKGDSLDWRAIDISFKRNLPTNETEIANMVNQLRGLVSEETLVAQIPFVSDVASEVEKLQQEKEMNMSLYNFNFDKEIDDEE